MRIGRAFLAALIKEMMCVAVDRTCCPPSRAKLVRINFYELNAIRGTRNIDFRADSCSHQVLGSDILLKRSHCGDLNQIDGASTEPASRHSRTDDAKLCFSKLHHQVEFPAAYFVVIAQTEMGIMHQRAQRLDVTALERLNCAFYAFVFADHMPTTQINLWR